MLFYWSSGIIMRITIEGERHLPEESGGKAWFAFVINDHRYTLVYLWACFLQRFEWWNQRVPYKELDICFSISANLACLEMICASTRQIMESCLLSYDHNFLLLAQWARWTHPRGLAGLRRMADIPVSAHVQKSLLLHYRSIFIWHPNQGLEKCPIPSKALWKAHDWLFCSC